MTDIRLAESIGIDRLGLIVEGKRFPFLLAAESIEVRAGELDIPTITITLLAENVQIDPLLTVETDGDVQFVSMGDVL